MGGFKPAPGWCGPPSCACRRRAQYRSRLDVIHHLAAEQPMHPATVVPIMPPSVQRLCVAGSRHGQVKSCSSAASRRRSSFARFHACQLGHRPDQWSSSRAYTASNRRPRPHSRTARPPLVPAPRGAPLLRSERQAARAASTSAASPGQHHPDGKLAMVGGSQRHTARRRPHIETHIAAHGCA